MTKYLLLKYLRFDRSLPFIMLSNVLAFIGVCLGVAVLIIAMSIMTGFDKEFERKLFIMNYPLSIYPRGFEPVDTELLSRLKARHKELLFSPFISSSVALKTPSGLKGAMLFGISEEDEKLINPIFAQALSSAKEAQNPFWLVLGKGLAKGVNFKDKLTIMFSDTSPLVLSSAPKSKRFSPRAIFSSELIAYDKSYLYTDINALAKILERQSYDGIHVHAKDAKAAQKLLQTELGMHYEVIGWWEQNGNFFEALALEKRALFIVLLLIILVASLNIISSLLMLVMNRRSEIALLLALGATRKEIYKAFFALGATIGLSGIASGFGLGFFGVYLLENFDIISLPADVYGYSKIPLFILPADLLAILFGSILIVLISSFYPAKKATGINVLNTLRNE